MTAIPAASRCVFRAIRFTRRLCLILLIGGALSGQTELRSSRDASYMVTVTELQHHVPKAARAEMEKARQAKLQNRTDEEIDHLKKAVLIDPAYVAARNNLAVALVATDPESAAEQLEEAITIDPHRSALFNNLAVAYTVMNKLGDAERAARTAADLNRTDRTILTVLGFVLALQHKYTAEALAYLERGCEQHPKARLYTAQILSSRREFDKAKSYVESYLASGDQEYRDKASRWLDVMNHRSVAGSSVLPSPF